MSLDPQIALLLDRVKRANRPPFWQQTPEQAREGYAKGARILEIAAAPVHQIDDFQAPTADGARIVVRRYMPRPTSGALPMLVFCHGGGFTIGSVDTHDAVARMLAVNADCIVISVDYRRAPEYKFPTASEDAWAALCWAHANAAELGADAGRIAIAGDSAGGTLTAGNAVRARDAGWDLRLQLLIYPGTSAWQDTRSHLEHADGYLLDGTTIQWFFSQYLRGDADRTDWRFAPLDAVPPLDLRGVAPACVMVAGYDPLHDEGVAYAERLRAAGVAVDLIDYPGMVHGFFNFGGHIAIARDAHRDAVRALRAAFA